MSNKLAPAILGQVIEKDKPAGMAQTITLTCGTMNRWMIEGINRDDAELYVGICNRKTELTNDLLEKAEKAQSDLIAMLSKNIPKEGQSMLESSRFQRETSRSGLTSHYLGVILVGHGLLIAPTFALNTADGQRAIVVQLLANNCHHRETSPLCRNQKDLVQDIALKVAQATQ